MKETAAGIISPLPNIQPKHFVLVHGAGHGAWCWFKLRHLLEVAGNKVTCLDLAAAGIDLAHPSSILSFDDYNKPLFDFMSTLSEGNKVILVGHSAGGLNLSHSLINFGDKIEAAIFIAATMLPSGFCTEEDVKDGVPDLSEYGDVCIMEYSLGPDKPPTNVALREEFQRKLLYHLSPVEDSVLASMLLRPSPSLALSTAKFEGNISQVRRIYIRTTHDKMVKPEQQDAMIRRWPPHEVFIIDTDHSPFFSSPQQLFELIVRASTSASTI
ncbi:hypothetical protein IEQ34_008348 [Dendrobium chrysotoxum]|uniref:AB hydrolase-1 domain-containing protein n=1 Tax=Dendrobium chrysotoxum TaxID=161865 RepID=A0AAV7GYM8_DENCH|nr:hypothetical protein IEQ34_008348 [Dendrobium chrysotoxum]